MGHYPARMDHAYRVRPECHDHITRPPSYYMKKIYYDTMVFGEAQLELLVKLWGESHVVIGTDYPYDMGYYKPVDFIERTKSLTRKQKDAILGGNAAKLLGLKPSKLKWAVDSCWRSKASRSSISSVWWRGCMAGAARFGFVVMKDLTPACPPSTPRDSNSPKPSITSSHGGRSRRLA